MLNFLIEKYESILNILFTLFIAWSLAGTTNSLIVSAFDTPAKGGTELARNIPPTLDTYHPQSAAQADYDVVLQRNIFDSQKRQPPQEKMALKEDAADPNAPPQKSSIRAALLGTMVFSNPRYSFATLREMKAEQETKNLYINDRILGEARITAIERNRIFFVYNGRNEFLEVENAASMVGPSIAPPPPYNANPAEPPSGSTIRREGNKMTIDQREVAAAIENMGTIAMQARVVPNFANGQVNGFKIFAIKPDSIYQKLGVQNGDIIQKINDFDINSPEKALQVYTQLRNEKNINIDLIRNGKKETVQIEVR